MTDQQPNVGWGAQPRQEAPVDGNLSQPSLPFALEEVQQTVPVPPAGTIPPPAEPWQPPDSQTPPQPPQQMPPPPTPEQEVPLEHAGYAENHSSQPPTPPDPPTPPAPQQAAPPQPAGQAQKTILQLLAEFSKQPSCERYRTDSERIKLLTDYLWLRQLTPTLPFETFLERYAEVADFDAENLKHPADALKYLLPRTKKLAEETGREQWTAKKTVDYTALYVDMIRLAETTNTPVPLSLNGFLTSEQLLAMYKAGELTEPEPAKPAKRSGRKQSSAEPVRPTGPNQRCIYTAPGGRQHRGHTRHFWTEETTGFSYVHFEADSGELYQGIGVTSLSVVDDPQAKPPETPEGDAKPELDSKKVRVPQALRQQIQNTLSCPGPLGTVELGDVCHSFTHTFQGGHQAVISIINSEPRPYVDAALIDSGGRILYEVQPRENLEGLYTFETEKGYYLLEIVS